VIKWKDRQVNNKINKSLFIEGREWHDKTYGNSYFSARIWIDGEIVGVLPFQYGYGDHYKSVAQRWLTEQGYLPASNRGIWAFAEEFGFDYYTVKSVTKKSEMFKVVA
jgi:hypothetical protein